jgi:PAS domain S-box-containing protein
MTILIIAFSSVITLVLSIGELVNEYGLLRKDMDKELEAINIYVPSMSAEVWDFDEKMIQLSLNGLVLLPNIDRVTLSEAATERRKNWVASVSGRHSTHTLLRRFPLMHKLGTGEIQIGTLEVVASLDYINRQILSRIASIILGNAFKTFLVALFITYLFRRMVTDRVENLARKVETLAPAILKPYRPDAVRAPVAEEPDPGDELTMLERTLADAVQQLSEALTAMQKLTDDLSKRSEEKEKLLASLNDSLRTQQEQLNFTTQLLAVLPIPTYYKDANGRYLNVNAAWERHFNIPAEEVVGKNARDLFDDKLAAYFESHDATLWADKKPQTNEAMIRTRDGRMREVIVYKAPFTDTSGNMAGIIGSVADITEHKEAMRGDAEKRRLLQRINSAVEEERKNIADELHDHLNASLIVLRLQAEQILQIAVARTNDPVFSQIAEKIRSILKDTGDLYTRARAIVKRLRPEVIDTMGLRGAIEDMVSQYEDIHPHCHFEFHADDLPQLSDSLIMTTFRLAQEALSNVIKHANATQCVIELHVSVDGKHIEMKIQDNGVGFDLDAAGSGLGLIAMKERVHGAGGKLTMASASNAGTTIAVTLPICEDQAVGALR